MFSTQESVNNDEMSEKEIEQRVDKKTDKTGDKKPDKKPDKNDEKGFAKRTDQRIDGKIGSKIDKKPDGKIKKKADGKADMRTDKKTDKRIDKKADKKTDKRIDKKADKKTDLKPRSPSEARLQRKANDQKVIRGIRIIFVSIIVLAVIGVAAGIYLSTYQPVVAWIGKTSVTLPEFNYFLSLAKTEILEGPEYDETLGEANFWESNIDGVKVIDMAKENALTNVQQTKIFVNKAKQSGVKLDSEELKMVNSLIDNMVNEANGDRAVASDTAKSEYGTTLGELKKIYHQLYLSNKFSNVEYERVTGLVTDDDARARYNDSLADYEQVTVRHILISYEGEDTENPRTPEESEALANDVLARVVAGDDFVALVEEYSDDTDSIETGGEYTFTRNQSYAPEFIDWSFQASVGDVDIVETQFGYHIMRLDDKFYTPFEEVKDYLVSSIASDRLDEQFEGWASDPQFEKRENDKVYPGISWRLQY